MSNGIYTALDQDIDSLMHFGRLGMKWYQHLMGVQQSLSKYAKGANTKGVEIKTLKKQAMLARDLAKEQKDAGNKEGYKYWKKESKEYWKKGKEKWREAKNYNKRTRVRRAIAGAAAKVVRAGAHALYRSIVNANKVKRFVKNKNYREKVITNWKKKASDFGKTIRTALGNFGKSKNPGKNPNLTNPILMKAKKKK